ncbi:MAG: response regulator [Nitrospiraceae bacterium]|nr:response regulator [Nitrospiraceae bacterium]
MKKILVVDDEENICRLYREELEDMGYEVTTVCDGTSALDAMDKAVYDLVTLDMRMKGIDGIETLRRMKEKNANLPVIISSAYEEFKNDFGSWCSDAYIVKSADTTALRETIKKILG